MTDQATSWIRRGDIEIAMIWDGTLTAEMKTILRLDPAEAERLVAAEATATGSDPLVLPVRAFLFRIAGRLVLCDAGSGTTKGPTMGFLPSSLNKLGVSPADIDAILLTHLHMDHIGGLTDAAGIPAFPRAELVIHAREAEYFLDTPDDSLDARSRRHAAVQRSIVAAYGSRQRRVRDGEGLPGIAARLAPGHTPGHTAWMIGQGAHTVAAIGDVVHMAAIQLPRPLTPMIYDVDPDLAGRSRIALLDEIATSRALVAGAHLSHRGLGTIDKHGDAYTYTALAV